MKEQIITEVMQQMLVHLDNAQMQHLKGVLEKTLFGCEITAQTEKEKTNNNPRLIEAFISATRIELYGTPGEGMRYMWGKSIKKKWTLWLKNGRCISQDDHCKNTS